MREWCECGAAVRASRKDVLAWRTDHLHPGKKPDKVPDKNGAISSTTITHRWSEVGEQPIIRARIGFQPAEDNS